MGSKKISVFALSLIAGVGITLSFQNCGSTNRSTSGVEALDSSDLQEGDQFMGSQKRYSLTNQETVAGCMPSNSEGSVTTPFGGPCSVEGQTQTVNWGTSNAAKKLGGGTCPAGQGPIAKNTYTCISCASGNFVVQDWTINNGDINFQGATQGVKRLVCN